MIHTSLSPNATLNTKLTALGYFLLPYKWLFWKKGNDVKKIENYFSKRYHTDTAVSFSAGREALYAILKTLKLEKEDEVILQAFTCIVVPNAIQWAGGKPVYVDIDSSLNIDTKKLKESITTNTKAIIIQHTFGIPADIDGIRKIAKEKGIFLIEDCAHALGAQYHGKDVGTFGDAAIFSFGRDKIISSVQGGIAIMHNEKHKGALREIQKNSPSISTVRIGQNLAHPIIFWLVKHLYSFLHIGKVILIVFQKIHALNRVYTKSEQRGEKQKHPTHKYPNAMASILVDQIKNLKNFNEHRQSIAKEYKKEIKNLDYQSSEEGSIYLRFTLFSRRRDDLIAAARKKNIYLGDWYKTVVMPNTSKNDYINGSCPEAEKYSSTAFNVPTHRGISIGDVKIVSQFLKDFG